MSIIYYACAIRHDQPVVGLPNDINTLFVKLLRDSGHTVHAPFEMDNTDEDAIKKRDLDLIKESDLFIAECSKPSHGVGYEIMYAERIVVGTRTNGSIPILPVLIMHHNSVKLSAMLKPSRTVMVAPYDDFTSGAVRLARFQGWASRQFGI